MSNEMLDAVDDLYANANRLIAGIGESQWDTQTPCDEWNVRELVNHMARTSRMLTASATRTTPTFEPDADHLGDDPAGAFADFGAAAAAAWRSDGALEGMISIPAEMPATVALGINILDIGLHCWDLADATGQEHGLTDAQISTIDDLNRQIISDGVRSGGGFGDILQGADQGGLEGMLAFAGRKG